MSAESILDLARRLEQDEDLHQDYLVRKLGYDPSIPAEVEKSLEILSGASIITQISGDTYSTWPQLCLMTQNISAAEYADCVSKDPTSAAAAALLMGDSRELFLA